MPAATPDQDNDYQQFLQDVQTASSGRPAPGASAPASNVPPASSGDPDFDDFLNGVAKASAATAPSPPPKPKAAEQEGGYWENVPKGTAQAPTPVSSILHGAASNILPDIGHAAASGYEAIKDWRNTGPAMWDAVKQIGTGIDSKIDGYASMHNSTASKKMGGACQSCHTSGGTAKGWWTAAGTIYTEDYSTVYPNATINFYTGPNGTGNLIGTLEVDAEGNFYSSTLALPAEGYYPQVVGTTGNILNMPQLCLSGNCNACHGVTSAKIWIN